MQTRTLWNFLIYFLLHCYPNPWPIIKVYVLIGKPLQHWSNCLLKLQKTRDHLKRAITRIVELEERDAKQEERINQLELKMTLMSSKLETLEERPPLSDVVDSIDEQWTADREMDTKRGKHPPGESAVQGKGTDTVPYVKKQRGGRSNVNPTHEDSESGDDESQQEPRCPRSFEGRQSCQQTI